MFLNALCMPVHLHEKHIESMKTLEARFFCAWNRLAIYEPLEAGELTSGGSNSLEAGPLAWLGKGNISCGVVSNSRNRERPEYTKSIDENPSRGISLSQK